MGQNWELISNAVNSIVRFKSVHRQPNECKEGHKVLMDRSSSDGADSAEDSGSSQRYHNSRHRQGNSKELKNIMHPHSSHVIALSQACVNKLPGGSLTPNLDSVSPGSLSLGSHTNPLPNHQGSAMPAIPTSNLNSRLPGAPGVVVGNNLPSSSSWNIHRDAQKYSVPILSSLWGDEQPKIQYNQV